jgi:hypothetical protein
MTPPCHSGQLTLNGTTGEKFFYNTSQLNPGDIMQDAGSIALPLRAGIDGVTRPMLRRLIEETQVRSLQAAAGTINLLTGIAYGVFLDINQTWLKIAIAQNPEATGKWDQYKLAYAIATIAAKVMDKELEPLDIAADNLGLQCELILGNNDFLPSEMKVLEQKSATMWSDLGKILDEMRDIKKKINEFYQLQPGPAKRQSGGRGSD